MLYGPLAPRMRECVHSPRMRPLVRILLTVCAVLLVLSRIWLDACLKTSTFTDGFCNGVPSPDEMLRSASWRNDVLAPVQNDCYSDVRAKKKT